MHNRRGFTLAEILGVIVILGLLVLLLVPGVMNRLRSSGKKAEETGYEIVYSSAQQFLDSNRGDYPPGRAYCISIKKLVADGKLVSPVINVLTGENIEDKSILVNIYKSGITDFSIRENDECEEISLLPIIDFNVTPNGWSNSKTVTIIYPEGGSNHSYQKDSDGLAPVSISENGGEYDVIFDKIGRVYAKMDATTKSGKKVVIEAYKSVDNIDKEKPIISSTSCSGNSGSISISDSLSGISSYKIVDEDDQIIKEENFNPSKKSYLKDGISLDRTKLNKLSVTDLAGNVAEGYMCISNPVKVTFDPNGGSVEQSLKIYEAGKKYKETIDGEFPSATRAGYTFKNWYTAKTGGSAVTSNTKVPDEDHTLYARWSAKKIKVDFYANSSIFDSIEQTYNSNYVLPENPTKSGYYFAGWYSEDNCKGNIVTAATKVTSVNDHNLYACWSNNGWAEDNNCKFYIENGKKVVGWKKIGNYWYYFNSEGCMVTGWIDDPSSGCPSNKYYTNEEGKMQMGWLKYNNKWYYLAKGGSNSDEVSGLSDKRHPAGCMLTGWIKDPSSTSCPSRWYYTNSDGTMQVGWKKVNNKWYYLAKGNNVESKWQSSTSKKPEGCMLTGWVYDEEYECRTHGWYFNSGGDLATSKAIGNYHVNSSGCWDQTWDSCHTGDYCIAGDVWSDTAGGWHSGYCEAGNVWNSCASRKYECCAPTGGGQGFTCSNGIAAGSCGWVCYGGNVWDSCATYHSGYYTGAWVHDSCATYVPCKGAWVPA